MVDMVKEGNLRQLRLPKWELENKKKEGMAVMKAGTRKKKTREILCFVFSKTKQNGAEKSSDKGEEKMVMKAGKVPRF